MDSQLPAILLTLTVVIGTFIGTAYGSYGSQAVCEITTGKGSHVSQCSTNADYGLVVTVTKEECEGAAGHIGKTLTATGDTTPRVYDVKYKSSDEIYYGIYLAYCGAGVYVKVIGTGEFVVFYVQ